MSIYSDCYYCGEIVEEQLVSREIRWQGQLFVFEGVPVGICVQCGEKVLKPRAAKAIDRMIQEKQQPTKIIQVPVYHYESSAT